MGLMVCTVHKKNSRLNLNYLLLAGVTLHFNTLFTVLIKSTAEHGRREHIIIHCSRSSGPAPGCDGSQDTSVFCWTSDAAINQSVSGPAIISLCITPTQQRPCRGKTWCLSATRNITERGAAAELPSTRCVDNHLPLNVSQQNSRASFLEWEATLHLLTDLPFTVLDTKISENGKHYC